MLFFFLHLWNWSSFDDNFKPWLGVVCVFIFVFFHFFMWFSIIMQSIYWIKIEMVCAYCPRNLRPVASIYGSKFDLHIRQTIRKLCIYGMHINYCPLQTKYQFFQPILFSLLIFWKFCLHSHKLMNWFPLLYRYRSFLFLSAPICTNIGNLVCLCIGKIKFVNEEKIFVWWTWWRTDAKVM